MAKHDWPDSLDLGPVTVLTGIEAGAYPHGNSVLVEGSERTALFDPSLTVVARGGVPAEVDLVVLSHVHEDHVPGLSLFSDAAVHVHELDWLGVESLDGLCKIYGMVPESEAGWRQQLLDDFHYRARPDAFAFKDGDVLDLGGVQIEVVHTPGHTKGHSALVIPEASAVFLGDIELSGFGPYYGDAWSDLEDFERSIERCRQIDVEHFITFHHKGTISGRPEFLEMLDKFAAAIPRREAAMLEFLREPHTLDEMVETRFIYRPHVEAAFLASVERRSAILHLERFVKQGRVTELEPGLWRAGGSS